MICIGCPMGCPLQVEKKGDGTFAVTGAGCIRGIHYAEQEATAPKRMVTGLVSVAATRRPLSVKTKQAVPKEKIGDIIRHLREITCTRPIRIGDVIEHNLCGTGIDLVSTSNVF